MSCETLSLVYSKDTASAGDGTASRCSSVYKGHIGIRRNLKNTQISNGFKKSFKKLELHVNDHAAPQQNPSYYMISCSTDVIQYSRYLKRLRILHSDAKYFIACRFALRWPVRGSYLLQIRNFMKTT
jgi:hypothetical protein